MILGNLVIPARLATYSFLINPTGTPSLFGVALLLKCLLVDKGLEIRSWNLLSPSEQKGNVSQLTFDKDLSAC